MNFLKICQDVNDLLGLQGTISTVEGASGYQKKLVLQTNKCWEDIQNKRPNWIFNQEDVEFTTQIGKYDYTIEDLFGIDAVSPIRYFKYILRNDTKQPLRNISLLQYTLDDTKNKTNSQVSLYAIDDVTQTIYINPPSEEVSLQLYYYLKTQTLELDTDEPYLPSEFHNIIVYKAVSELALFYGSFDLASLYSQKYLYELGALCRSQIPSEKVRV